MKNPALGGAARTSSLGFLHQNTKDMAMTERVIFRGDNTAAMLVEKDSDGKFVGFVWLYKRGGIKGGTPNAQTAPFSTEAEAWLEIEPIARRLLKRAETI
jgi:hypothetical protein